MKLEIELITPALKLADGIPATGESPGGNPPNGGGFAGGGNGGFAGGLGLLPLEPPPLLCRPLAGRQSVLTLKSALAQDSPLTQLKLI